MKRYPAIRLDEEDKRLFQKFKKMTRQLRHTVPDWAARGYYIGAVKEILKSGSGCLYLYGSPKMELQQKDIEMFLKSAKDYDIFRSSKRKDAYKTGRKKINTDEYLKLTAEVAEKLNKYVVGYEEPDFKAAMKNYEFMCDTLADIPYFHDGYIIDCKEDGKDVLIRFGLSGSKRYFIENLRIYEMNPRYRLKRKESGKRFRSRWERHEIVITIKFVNAELLEGSYDVSWVDHMNFLDDLTGRKTDDGRYLFELGAITEGALSLICDHIEFVRSRYDGTFLIPCPQAEHSAYYEFQQGKVDDSCHWLDSSVLIDDFNDDGVMDIFAHFIKGFSAFSATLIDRQAGEKLAVDLRQFRKLLDDGVGIINALEAMNVYDPSAVESTEEPSGGYDVLPWQFLLSEKLVLDFDPEMIKNTASVLADWIDETVKEYGYVTVKGVGITTDRTRSA